MLFKFVIWWKLLKFALGKVNILSRIHQPKIGTPTYSCDCISCLQMRDRPFWSFISMSETHPPLRVVRIPSLSLTYSLFLLLHFPAEMEGGREGGRSRAPLGLLWAVQTRIYRGPPLLWNWQMELSQVYSYLGGHRGCHQKLFNIGIFWHLFNGRIWSLQVTCGQLDLISCWHVHNRRSFKFRPSPYAKSCVALASFRPSW